MSPSHARRQALARLHGMACLGTGGTLLIEPLLQELHRVIGFDSGGYFYPGADGELDAFMESPDVQASVPEHLDPGIQHSENLVFRNTLRAPGDIVLHEHGPRSMEQMLRDTSLETLLRSDYYNVVMRPAQVRDWLCLPLRTPQGQGVGMLFLFRSARAQPFQPEEVALLARLEHQLAYILQGGEMDAQDSEIHSEGVLVATLEGQPLWISPEAEALMPLAFGWRWRRGAQLPAALLELLRRLRAPSGRMELPAMRLHTAHGWFSLRAILMNAAHAPLPGQPEHAVALHITHRVARGVRLLSTLQTLALPQRQHELAWWLARGLSESQVAQRMGISLNTAVYHRRQLYNRLDVTGREELLSKLGHAVPARR
ncbi:helix-turn-helix transcriptional regulator [Diaphorobacter ruginosibacter]|nr:GAF domain-containing protein [Diaphorobacter ruginosibacter]